MNLKGLFVAAVTAVVVAASKTARECTDIIPVISETQGLFKCGLDGHTTINVSNTADGIGWTQGQGVLYSCGGNKDTLSTFAFWSDDFKICSPQALANFTLEDAIYMFGELCSKSPKFDSSGISDRDRFINKQIQKLETGCAAGKVFATAILGPFGPSVDSETVKAYEALMENHRREAQINQTEVEVEATPV